MRQLLTAIKVTSLAGSVGLLAFFFPAQSLNLDIIGQQSQNISTIFSIIIAFLITEALERQNAIDAAVDLELNKLRHIFHLSEFLAKEPVFKDWRLTVVKNLHAYLGAFKKIDFRSYETTDDEFRRLTHALYAAPLRTDGAGSQLYAEMLRASSTLSETRQNLRSLASGGLSHYVWGIMISVTIAFLILSTIFSDGSLGARIASSLLAVSVTLMLDFLWRIDRPNRRWAEELADRYVETVKKLELA